MLRNTQPMISPIFSEIFISSAVSTVSQDSIFSFPFIGGGYSYFTKLLMRNHSILLLYKLLPVSVGPFFTKISFGATVSQQTEDDFYHSH